MSSSATPLDLRARLMKGGAGAFGLRVCALVLGFVADIVLTRTLGLENYGLYAIGISWLSLLVPLASLGLGTALLKVVPAESASGEHGRVRGVLGFAGRWMFAASIVLGALMATGVALAGDRIGPELRLVLWILAGFLPIQVLSLHRQSVLQALKFPVLALLPEQVVRVAVFLATACVLHVWRGAQLSPADAALAYGAGMLASLICAGTWARKRTPVEVQRARPMMMPSAWWLLALPMCWNTLMRLLNSRADPAMLGWLMGENGAEGAAAFALANRLASLLLFGTVAVNAVAAPYIAELHAKGERGELQRLVTLASKGLALYAFPLAAVLLVFGPWILGLFGEGFDAAYGALVLLVVARLVTCSAGLLGFLLSLTGHQGRVAKWMTLAAMVKVASNLLLIPRFGAEGAAAGTIAMLGLFTVLAWRDARRLLGIEPTLFACLGWLPAAPEPAQEGVCAGQLGDSTPASQERAA